MLSSGSPAVAAILMMISNGSVATDSPLGDMSASVGMLGSKFVSTTEDATTRLAIVNGPHGIGVNDGLTMRTSCATIVSPKIDSSLHVQGKRLKSESISVSLSHKNTRLLLNCSKLPTAGVRQNKLS